MVEQHEGCALAIVGSRDLPKFQLEAKIKEVLLDHKPSMVISGGARARYGFASCDEDAARIAEEQGIAVLEFIPESFRWEAGPIATESKEQVLGTKVVVTVPGGFRRRNEAIADACECLVRIASTTTKTYGSGWTADYAEKIGKNVERFVVS